MNWNRAVVMLFFLSAALLSSIGTAQSYDVCDDVQHQDMDSDSYCETQKSSTDKPKYLTGGADVSGDGICAWSDEYRAYNRYCYNDEESSGNKNRNSDGASCVSVFEINVPVIRGVSGTDQNQWRAWPCHSDERCSSNNRCQESCAAQNVGGNSCYQNDNNHGCPAITGPGTNPSILCSGGSNVGTCNQNNIGATQAIGGTTYTCTQLGWSSSPAQACALYVGQTGQTNYLTNSPQADKCCGNNAILNPSFENTLKHRDVGGNIDRGWQTDANVAGIDSDPHLGDVSVELSNNHYEYQYVAQTATGVSGTLVLSFYAKAKFGGVASSGRVWLQACDRSGNQVSNCGSGGNENLDKCTVQFGTASYPWERYMATCTTISGDAKQYRLVVKGTGQSQPVLIDDAYLISVSDTSKLDIGHITNSTPQSNTNKDSVCLFEESTQNNDLEFTWLNARTPASNTFKIHAVDNLYDVISNGDKWYSCNPGNFQFVNAILTGQRLNDTPGYQQGVGPGFGGGSGSGGGGTGGGSSTGGGGIIPGGNLFSGFTTGATGSGTSGGATLNFAPRILLANVPTTAFGLQGTGFSGTTISTTGVSLKNSTGGIYPATMQNTISISTGSFTGYVSLTGLPADFYSINVTTNSASYLFSNPDKLEVIPSGISGGGTPLAPNASRIVCHSEAEYGALEECCGLSFFGCMNQNLKPGTISHPKTKRVGETVSTIYDFFDVNDPATNYVGQIFFERDGQSGALTATQYFTMPFNHFTSSGIDQEMRIKDWSSYDNLEFDIAFANDDNLRIYIFDTSVDTSDLDDVAVNLNKAVFNAKIKNFIVDQPGAFAWHHISIPLAAYGLNRKNIGLIMFAEKPNDAIGASPLYTLVNGQTVPVVLYGIDRLYLTRDSEANNHRFCGFSTAWIKDLDSDSVGCNNVVSSSWSGSRCCGDDQGRFGNPDETFNDGFAGCWRGITVRNDSIVNVTVP